MPLRSAPTEQRAVWAQERRVKPYSEWQNARDWKLWKAKRKEKLQQASLSRAVCTYRIRKKKSYIHGTSNSPKPKADRTRRWRRSSRTGNQQVSVLSHALLVGRSKTRRTWKSPKKNLNECKKPTKPNNVVFRSEKVLRGKKSRAARRFNLPLFTKEHTASDRRACKESSQPPTLCPTDSPSQPFSSPKKKLKLKPNEAQPCTRH